MEWLTSDAGGCAKGGKEQPGREATQAPRDAIAGRSARQGNAMGGGAGTTCTATLRWNCAHTSSPPKLYGGGANLAGIDVYN